MKEFNYDVKQMIKAVKDRPCIWDKTLEIYRDRMERRKAWEEIFRSLDYGYDNMTPEGKRLTGEQILRKWTNLRDIFVKSLKPSLRKQKRKYLLYEEMKFLTKIYGNLEQKEENETYEVAVEDGVPCMKEEGDADSFSSQDAEASMTISNITSFAQNQSSSQFDESTSFNTSRGNFSGRKKSKRFTSEDGNDIFKKKSRRSAPELNDSDADHDRLAGIDFVQVDAGEDPRVMNEDEAFFASLLPTVVKYNEDEKLQFRIEVLGVMKQIKDKRKWAGE